MRLHFNHLKGEIIGQIFTFIFCISASSSLAQAPATQASVVTTFNPPYTIPLSEIYTSQQLNVIVTAINGPIPSGKISLIIQGNNGIRLENNYMTSPFSLDIAQGEPHQLTEGDVDEIFQQGNFSAAGITVAQAFSEGLPAGNYEMCFRVYVQTRTTWTPISQAPPLGCGSFVIQDLPNAVTVTTIVQPPPFTSDFALYLDKIYVTLFSVARRNVKLFLTLKGDNGVVIRSRPGVITPQAITLQGGVPYILTSADLDSYFDFQNLVFSGVSSNAVSNNGLPEGNYRFCIRAVDTNGNFISVDDPMGCSNLFTIRLLEPPQIINPQCGLTIKATAAQNIVFSWTPPPGAPPDLPYTLRLVEMIDPNRNPNDAMLSATTPAFLEEAIIGTTTFLYGPAQPVLEPGRRYAWQVIAGQGAGADVLNTSKLFRNDGKSAVCSFLYEPAQLQVATAGTHAANFSILLPACEDTLSVSAVGDFYFKWGWLSNNKEVKQDSIFKEIASYDILIKGAQAKQGKKVDSKFSYQTSIGPVMSGETLPMHLQKTAGQADNMGLKHDYWYSFEVKALNKNGTELAKTQSCDLIYQRDLSGLENAIQIAGSLLYRFDNYPESHPVVNTAIRIRKAFKQQTASEAEKLNAEASATYSKTSDNGDFTFLVPPQTLVSAEGADSLFFQIDILSPYYSPITKVFSIHSEATAVKLGHQLTTVYNYTLKLYVEKSFNDYELITEDKYYNSSGKLVTEEKKAIYSTDTTIKEVKEGIPVMVYRKQKPGYIPIAEGQITKSSQNVSPQKYIVVATGKTMIETEPNGKKRAYVIFNRLLCNVPAMSADVYFIKAVNDQATPSGDSPVPYQDGLYEAPEQQLIFERPPGPFNVTHFNIERTYEIKSKEPPKSHLSGQLVYQWPSDLKKSTSQIRPLSNAKFQVVVEYLFNGKPVVPMKYTDPYGGFIHTDLVLDGQTNPLNLIDAGLVMASGKTDANGHFEVDVVNLNSKGLLGSGKEEKKGKKGDVPVVKPDLKDLVDPTNPLMSTTIDLLTTPPQNDIINFNDLESSAGAQQNVIQNLLNEGSFKNSVGSLNGASILFYDTDDLLASSAGLTPLSLSSQQSQSNGTIQRVFRIRIENSSIFYNPQKDIAVDAFKAKDTGPITVMVKEAQWNVQLKDKNNKKLLTGLKEVIFRDPLKKLPGLPDGEGDGLYRKKKLINPQLKGEVTLPAAPKNLPKQKSGEPVTLGSNENFNSVAKGDVNVVATGDSWNSGEYEWLADTVTDSKGIASFQRLLMGFKNYYVEAVSNPSTGELFYNATIQPLYANAWVTNNTEYSNYWDTRKKDLPEINTVINMDPLPSRIAGRVIDKSSGKGLEKSLVFLYDKNQTALSFCATDDDGYFEFSNAVKESGFTFSLKAFHYGFKQESIAGKNGIQKTGEQYVKEILMVPSATLTGIIKNEQGEPVDAYIQREDGLVISNKKKAPGKIQPAGTVPGKFELAVPEGKGIKFYVIPKDVGYFNDTISVEQVHAGVNDMGTIYVYRRAHRMNFIVADAGNTQLRIKGAHLMISKDQSLVTNEKGEASFHFENVSVNNYTFHVAGPAGSAYIPQILNIENQESETPKLYVIKLKKGGTISGIVNLDGAPVAGAKVYLDYQQQSQSSGLNTYVVIQPPGQGTPLPQDAISLPGGKLPAIETYSDNQGKYHLVGIPVNSGSISVVATLDTTFTVVGDQQKSTLSNGSATVDLHLKRFTQMQIASLYGFPLSIESVETSPNSKTVKVTGQVHLDVARSDFGFTNATATSLRVRDVVFEPKVVKGVTLGVAVSQEVKAETAVAMKMQYAKRYNVSLTNSPQGNDELTITRGKDGKGQLNGTVHIVDNSFNYPSSYLNFANKDQFFLAEIKSGSIETKIPGLQALQTENEVTIQTISKSEGPVMNPFKKFNLCNATKGAVSFKFINFNSTANPLSSYIDQEGKIHLNIGMDCKIPNAKPEQFTVNIEDVVLDNDKVYAAPGKSALKLTLEKWSVEVQNWVIDPQKGGLYSQNGLIKTGKLDVPFGLFNLRADMFVMDNFKLDELQLGGGVKMLEDIPSGAALLVYDNKTGSDMSAHWKLSVTGNSGAPAARIKNLSPFLNKNVEIEYIQLLSNNEDILSVKQGGGSMSILGNPLAAFNPSTIFSGPDFFSLGGVLTIPAPRLNPISLRLVFSGTPSSLKMKTDPVETSFEAKGYVKFISNPNTAENITITPSKITIAGTVEEPQKFYPITATFFAENNSAPSYHVDVPAATTLNLTDNSSSATNGFNLLIASGGMKVDIDDWTLLSFTGRLRKGTNPKTNSGNIGDNELVFTVHGDVQVDSKKMQINNIPDLPGFKMVYDFQQKCLIGSLSLDGFKIGAGLEASIPIAEVLFGQQGWYFGAGGQIKKTPLGDFNAGVIIGEHQLNSTLKKIITQYSYTNDLCDFNNQISGFFVTGGKPIIDEGIAYNFGVASGAIKAQVGLEASFLMDFATSTYMLKAGAYGFVKASIGSIVCTEISGGADVKGIVEAGYQGGSFTGGADVSLKFNAKLTQGIQTAVLGCEGQTTFFDEEICAGFKLKINNNGFNPDFSLSCFNGLTCK